MKTIVLIPRYKTLLVFFVLLFISKMAVSQVDTTAAKSDSAKTTDKKKKKTNGFIVYGAATFNQLSMSSSTYESVMVPGWGLGIAYRRGRFVYWQVGTRYNNALYEVHLAGALPDSVSDNFFSVTDIDIPITGGINLLSATKKILGLRLFLSAVPAFVLKVGNNGYKNFNKDHVNDFNFYGQAGLGVDILALFVEAGYNYGFTDVFKTAKSNPQQIFINIGFRF